MDPMVAYAEALRLVRAANAGLAASVCPESEWRRRLACLVAIEQAAGYGKATVAARLGDPDGLARLAGTSVGRARDTIATGEALSRSPVLGDAVADGSVSLDQAAEITRAAAVAPDAVEGLVATARGKSFRALRDEARRVRLAAEPPDLGVRQHRARRLRHWVGELGMVHLDAALEPHVGALLVERLERRARRLRQDADTTEPWERHLADALADTLSGGSGGARRRGDAEVVVLVSHEVARRGWDQVREGEHCRIPGVGPIPPQVARDIAADAFVSGVVFDGTDLREMKRWTRSIPPEIRLALRLGDPPEFDGPRCVDCGKRLSLEIDHVYPVAAGGETSLANNRWRCEACHHTKTRTDHDTIRSHRRREREAEPQIALLAQPP